jgi:hypothetical protein
MRRLAASLVFLAATFQTGCISGVDEFLDDLESIEIDLGGLIDVFQGTLTPPDYYTDEIIIQEDVVIVDDVTDDLHGVVLADVTLLGIENLTGFDISVTYLVDGVLQRVLVFDGETLLLDYACIFELEILSEEDYNPFTGALEQEFVFEDLFFLEGVDYFCGEAVILTFDPVTVTFEVADRVDLVR